jgi:hypothetical protein
MKLIDKQVVEATKPTIYVGRRTYKSKGTGQVCVAKPYWAEYFANGRQHQEPLGTANKAQAVRAAHALAERLERGQEKVSDSRRTIPELADGYYEHCQRRGRAKKTLVKYKGQLERFKSWCDSENIRRARTFSPDDLFAYRTYLADECKLSDKSIYTETIVIKQLFKWATKNGHLSRNLLEPVCFPKVKSPMRTNGPCQSSLPWRSRGCESANCSSFAGKTWTWSTALFTSTAAAATASPRIRKTGSSLSTAASSSPCSNPCRGNQSWYS